MPVRALSWILMGLAVAVFVAGAGGANAQSTGERTDPGKTGVLLDPSGNGPGTAVAETFSVVWGKELKQHYRVPRARFLVPDYYGELIRIEPVAAGWMLWFQSQSKGPGVLRNVILPKELGGDGLVRVEWQRVEEYEQYRQ